MGFNIWSISFLYAGWIRSSRNGFSEIQKFTKYFVEECVRHLHSHCNLVDDWLRHRLGDLVERFHWIVWVLRHQCKPYVEQGLVVPVCLRRHCYHDHLGLSSRKVLPLFLSLNIILRDRVYLARCGALGVECRWVAAADGHAGLRRLRSCPHGRRFLRPGRGHRFGPETQQIRQKHRPQRLSTQQHRLLRVRGVDFVVRLVWLQWRLFAWHFRQ